ncbi:MAG: FliI/YscN family ATPase [Phycisphaeraceae bacterium]
MILADKINLIDQAASLELQGTVAEVRGLAVRVADLPVPIGSMVRIVPKHGRGGGLDGEVVGFDRDQTIIMPLGSTAGVGRGDPVVAEQFARLVWIGDGVLGRVLDGLGRPIDGRGPVADTAPRPLVPPPVDPLDRPLIDTPLATGIRAIDALISVGRGQRVGVFSAPGLGKSTLLGMMARHTTADVSVIALVGERGREVRDFIENHLGERGIERCAVVCATADEPALLRIRAAMVATAIAEFFRDQGKDVLLIMDSVTRLCQAQRQVGLAAGEPPATKGYPPSVFAMLPSLLERSGRTGKGSITGFYAVLVEGDDLNEPISDATRGILDGHILLTQNLVSRGHWPAIDVLGSISRVTPDVIDPDHDAARREVLRLVSAYQQVEDLLNIGAYATGSNNEFDLAITCKPVIDLLLQQGRNESVGKGDFASARKLLLALTQQIQTAKQQLQKPQKRAMTV